MVFDRWVHALGAFVKTMKRAQSSRMEIGNKVCWKVPHIEAHIWICLKYQRLKCLRATPRSSRSPQSACDEWQDTGLELRSLLSCGEFLQPVIKTLMWDTRLGCGKGFLPKRRSPALQSCSSENSWPCDENSNVLVLDNPFHAASCACHPIA